MGFDVRKTFVYMDTKYFSNHFLLNTWEFSKLVPFNQVRGAFGFNESTNIGRIVRAVPLRFLIVLGFWQFQFFPSLQCVAAFGNSYPEIWGDDPLSDQRSKRTAKYRCLIPMAIDQGRVPRTSCLVRILLTTFRSLFSTCPRQLPQNEARTAEASTDSYKILDLTPWPWWENECIESEQQDRYVWHS